MKRAEIIARMGVLLQESKGLIEKYPDFDFPTAEYDRAKAIDTELTALKGSLDETNTKADMVKRMQSFDQYVNEPASGSGNGGIQFPSDGGGAGQKRDEHDDGRSKGGREPENKDRDRGKTVSQLVLSDTEYQEWLQKLAPHGHFSEKVRIASPQVNIPGGLKALITGGTVSSAGAFVFPDIQENLDQFIRRRPLVMRDIITLGQTDSDLVEYVREVSETNNAAMVPEAQSTAPIGDGTGGTVTAAIGGLKPESAMVFERVTTPVRTVAHWIPATKRALADAGQMQTLIDGFLRYGLELELEDQMIIGNGTGENFTGLTNISGLTAAPWDTDILTTTRKAKTLVRVVGRARATAYLLNPYDWETIQLQRTQEGGPNTGQFYFGGPAANEVPTLWQTPVVESEGVPIGTGFVGDFRTLILWDRQQAGVQMTDSHNDFFVRNLVAILAEARAAYGCLRPASIVEIDLTAA